MPDDGNAKTTPFPHPERLLIERSPEGRIDIKEGPEDFLLLLGMLEWAHDKIWEMYRAQQQPRNQPTIQMPTPQWPPKGRN